MGDGFRLHGRLGRIRHARHHVSPGRGTGGSVTASVSEVGTVADGYGSYEIRVADSGIGMSREFVERIFDSFKRERNSTVSGVEDTGLGMSITKSIVDLMGGTIEVLTAPGSGTHIIRLKLKLAGESEDPRPGGQRAGGYPDRRHDRKRLFRGRQSRGAGRYTGAYRKACGYRGADEYAQVRPAAQVSARTK